MTQITELVPPLDENKIPIDGQSRPVFRANIAYIWQRLKQVILSLNIFASQVNAVQNEIDIKHTAVINQAVDGGYSQDYMNNNFSKVSMSASNVLINSESLSIVGTDLVLTNSQFVFTKGIGSKGYDKEIQTVTSAIIDFTGVSDGVKYVGKKLDGTGYVFEDTQPLYSSTIPTGTLTALTFCKSNGILYDKSSNPIGSISFFKPIITVASGTAVAIGNDVLAENVMRDIDADKIVVRDLVVTDGFDLGQQLVEMKPLRAFGVTYTNDTNKPIDVYITLSCATHGHRIDMYVDGLRVGISRQLGTTTDYHQLFASVSPQSTYSIGGHSTFSILEWQELR